MAAFIQRRGQLVVGSDPGLSTALSVRQLHGQPGALGSAAGPGVREATDQPEQDRRVVQRRCSGWVRRGVRGGLLLLALVHLLREVPALHRPCVHCT